MPHKISIQHPAVVSEMFHLVATLEFDLSIGGQFFPARVELFQSNRNPRRWRAHLWELDYYRIEGTFPVKGKKNRPVSDETLMVERTWEISSRFHHFEAPSARAAIKLFLDRLQQYLQRARR